jgi:hypothetical protein
MAGSRAHAIGSVATGTNILRHDELAPLTDRETGISFLVTTRSKEKPEMIPTMSLVFGGAPATASIPASGLEPVFFAVIALLTFAATRLAYAAWSAKRPSPPASGGRSSPRLVRPLPRLNQPSWSDAV